MRFVICLVLASSGALGRAAPAQETAPLRFASLSLGSARTCGVTTDGAAFCWGSGSRDPITTPAPVPGGSAFSAISAETDVACGVTTNGKAYCWGFNYRGVLGIDSLKDAAVSLPVPVAGGLSFVSVSVRGSHACAVTATGTAYCWGGNGEGELGTKDTTDRAAPQAVAGALAFKAVTLGEEHTCGLTVQGAAYCWGDNGSAELGSTTMETCGLSLGKPGACSTTPVAVDGGLTFTMIAAGGFHTCGITSERAVYCWGNNRYGQLGVGDSSVITSTTPLPVSGGLRFVSVGGGAWHSCALAEDGHAYCWGQNDVGEVGEPLPAGVKGPVRVWAPVAVSGGMTFRTIAVGGRHACGITAGGETYCWGVNAMGSLGNGSRNNSAIPTKLKETPLMAAANTAAPAQPSDSELLGRARPDSALLRRALKVHPEDLALGFLAETYSLLAAQAAVGGVTVHTRLDGRDETINQSNAAEFVARYATRIKTYDVAIRQRGFATIAGSYRTTVSSQCARLGFSSGETIITQRDFHLQLANQSISHRGIVVESSLAVEHAADPDIQLIGRAREGRIELEYKPSKCVLTLTHR
jgi:alpha-tubulin suppressor-like RCC1 family protein